MNRLSPTIMLFGGWFLKQLKYTSTFFFPSNVRFFGCFILYRRCSFYFIKKFFLLKNKFYANMKFFSIELKNFQIFETETANCQS